MTTYDFTVPPPGYRLPADIRLGPVMLQSGDLGRSLAYYDRVLGLRTLERRTGEATLAAQHDPTPLVRIRERPGALPVPRRGRLGLYHFAILLPDRASLGRFAGHLAALGQYAGMADHLVSEAFYLTDPDGLGIEVYADRPRETWSVREGKLAMATDPLDLDGLAKASEGRRWDGAPPGTRIGHIHLYVDDLDRAGEFYHAGPGSTGSASSFPARSSCRPGGIIIIWAPTSGPPARRRPANGTPACLSGTSSCLMVRASKAPPGRFAARDMRSPARVPMPWQPTRGEPI